MNEEQTQNTEQRDELLKVEQSLQKFSKTEAGLVDLQKRYGGVVYNCEESKQLKLAKEARAEIKKPRVNVEKIRKAAKAPLLELGRQLDATAKDLESKLRSLEDPIDKQIKDHEQREAKRLAEIQERIDRFEWYFDESNEGGTTSEILKKLLNDLLDEEISAEIHQERETEALEKQNDVIAHVRKRIEVVAQREADAQELEELRREKEKREAEERAEEQRKAELKAAAQKNVDDANKPESFPVGPSSVPLHRSELPNDPDPVIEISDKAVADFSSVVNALADDDDFADCVEVDDGAFDDLPAAFDEEPSHRELIMHVDKMSEGELRTAVRAMRQALVDLMRSHDQLMPGVKHLALQDYAILNDAPMNATRLINTYRT